MKTHTLPPSASKGTSLLEAVIAIGVLAVAVPLVFGTLAETGNTTLSTQAESRSAWIAANCLNELELAMDQQSKLIDDLEPGKAFPSGGGVTAIAFTAEGVAVAKISGNHYEAGVAKMADQQIRYIASMSAELPAAVDGVTPVLQVKISLEYPAAAPAAKREKIDFHTVMP